MLEDVLTTLDITKKQMEKCIGKNIRVTVRRIMKPKYPSPSVGFKFADVYEEYICVARGKSSFLNT